MLNGFFWNGFFAFLYEGYLIITVCVLLNLVSIKWSTGGAIISSMLSYIFLLLICGFPIFVGVFYGYFAFLYDD